VPIEKFCGYVGGKSFRGVENSAAESDDVYKTSRSGLSSGGADTRTVLDDI